MSSRLWFVFCLALCLATSSCGTGGDDCAPGSDWPNRNMCPDEAAGDDDSDEDDDSPPRGPDAGTAGFSDSGRPDLDAGTPNSSSDASDASADGSAPDGDAGPAEAGSFGFDAAHSQSDH